MSLRPADAAVLRLLYEATGGAGWANSTGWPDGGCDRHGIECSSSGEVTSLTLSRNSLAGTIPSAIGQLTALTQLVLHFNALWGTIPSTIGQLTAMTLSLGLNGNALSGTIALPPPSSEASSCACK